MHVESDQSKITVSIELWQNQNFWPTSGWSVPYFGVPHFVANFSETSVQSKDFPQIASPTNWTWAEEWNVDITGSFGPTDKEGWVYGSTFEGIIVSILNSSTSATPSSMDLCRKRRWVRSMVCTSPSLMKVVSARINRILQDNNRIQKLMDAKQEVIDNLLKYESLRIVNKNNSIEAILKPISKMEAKYQHEKFIVNSLKQTLVSTLTDGASNAFVSEVYDHYDSLSVLLEECSSEYRHGMSTWREMNENIKYLVKSTKKTLTRVLQNHVDEIHLASEELLFLRGAGCIGNLLPSGSKYLQSTKMKKRKISWDMPEMGCIWFGVKYYHQLVNLLQNHIAQTNATVKTLQEREISHRASFLDLVKKLQKLHPGSYDQFIKNIEYKTYVESMQQESSADTARSISGKIACLTPEQIASQMEIGNLPRLPQILGMFTVLFTYANKFNQSRVDNCIPTKDMRKELTPENDVLTVQGIEWCEVNIVISSDGFLHILSSIGDFENSVPLKSVPLKGSTIKLAKNTKHTYDTCVEIRPWVISYAYLIYHRLAGKKLSRADDGVVICVDTPELAQTLIDILCGNFLTYGPRENQFNESLKFGPGGFNAEDDVDDNDDVDEEESGDVLGKSFEKLKLEREDDNKQYSEMIQTTPATRARAGSSAAFLHTGGTVSGVSRVEKTSKSPKTPKTASTDSCNINVVFETEIFRELSRSSRAMSHSGIRYQPQSSTIENRSSKDANDSQPHPTTTIDTSTDNRRSRNTNTYMNLGQVQEDSKDSAKRVILKKVHQPPNNTVIPCNNISDPVLSNKQAQAINQPAELQNTTVSSSTTSAKSQGKPKPGLEEGTSPSGRRFNITKSVHNFEEVPIEYDVFPARFRGNRASTSFVREEEDPKLPQSKRLSTYIQQYTEGVRQSLVRESKRVQEVKASAKQDTTVTADINLVKVSEPFRIISPRAATARAVRPTSTIGMATSESILSALKDSGNHRDSSYRADSPTSIRASIVKTGSNDNGPARLFSRDEREESKRRAESVRAFRVKK